tara:strand:- start:684 stop:986 length:303 start_codon:yes stop_codon:yes gene_type:complete
VIKHSTVSEYLTESIFREIDLITNRLKSIAKTHKEVANKNLRHRIFLEYKQLLIRFKELKSIASLINTFPSVSNKFSLSLKEKFYKNYIEICNDSFLFQA